MCCFIDVLQKFGVFVFDHADQGRVAFAAVQRGLRQQFEQDETERKDVAACIDRAAVQLLRRQVGQLIVGG